MKVTVSCTIDYAYECEIDDDASDVLTAVEAADPVYFQPPHFIQAEGRILSIVDENGRWLFNDEF